MIEIHDYYSEDQPRDDNGRWGEGGGGSSSKPSGRSGHSEISTTDALSEREKTAVEFYQDDSGEINAYLRSGGDVDVGIQTHEHIAHLDSAIEKSVTTKDMTVYRGVAGHSGLAAVGKDAVGQEFTHKGFTSTSSNPDIAESFSGGRTGSQVVFEIKVPKGSNALDVARFGQSLEKEVLLPRNSRFKITGYGKSFDGVHVYTAELKK